MAFDGEIERPAPYTSGLAQGSPLSPVLFILYASVLSKGKTHLTEATTSYMDDEIMLQGSKSANFSCINLQNRLDERITRAAHLNIHYSIKKSELMHLIPTTSKCPPTDQKGITLYDTNIEAKDSIKALGGRIDHRLSFRIHASHPSARTRSNYGLLSQIAKRKGASPGALHNLATTITISGMLWRAEI